MNKGEFFKKITQKKSFSKLPEKDIELAFSHFEKRQTSDEEKVILTRDLLHKAFSSFASEKLLSPKNKTPEWILRKHLSTRERLPYYKELYKKLLKDFKSPAIIDLGAGINGFSYKYFEKQVEYIAVESIGQLVDLMNDYFQKEKIKGSAIHKSLFEIDEIKQIIQETKQPRIVFLFKVLDSLEMLKRNYSKEFLKEIAPLADKFVVSFATQSMAKREKFKAKRNWILDFIKEEFKFLEDFELGGERYVLFKWGKGE